MIPSSQSLTVEYRFLVRFHSSAVLIRTNAGEILPELKREFRYFCRRDGSVQNIVAELSVIRDGSVYHVPSTDDASVRNGTLADAVRCIGHHVSRLIVEATPDFLWLHAGAVARNGHAMLVVGASGSGKSTLVTALCTQGWSYLSDELVPLEFDTLHAIPFPLAPALRPESSEVLPSGVVAGLPKLTIDLPSASICSQPLPISAIVLPTFNPGAPCQMAACPPADVALELLRGCASLAPDPSRTLSGVSRLVQRAAGFRLTYRHGDQAARLVDEALGSSPGRVSPSSDDVAR